MPADDYNDDGYTNRFGVDWRTTNEYIPSMGSYLRGDVFTGNTTRGYGSTQPTTTPTPGGIFGAPGPPTSIGDYLGGNWNKSAEELAAINAAKQAESEKARTKYFTNIEKDFTTGEGGQMSYADLPIVKNSDGYYYYDAAAIAEAEGMSPEAVNYLRNEARTPLAQKEVYSMGDQTGLWDNRTKNIPAEFYDMDPAHSDARSAILLRNLARTRALSGAPIDLSNSTHLNNILTGNSTNRYDNVDKMNKALFSVPDKSHWYSPERIIPMATMAAMAAMSAGAGGAIMAPAATALGGTGGLAGAAITGLGAGSMATLPTAFMNTVQAVGPGLDVKAGLEAQKEATKQGLIGGGIGAATAGGMNLVGQGLTSAFGGGEQAATLDPAAMEKLVNDTSRATGMSPNQVMQMVQSMPPGQQDAILQSMLTEASLAAGATPREYFDGKDVVGDMAYETDYGIRNDATGDIWSYENIVPDNAYEIDYGTPSSRLYGVPTNPPPTNGLDYKSIMSKLLGLIQPDQAPTGDGPTGLSNTMWQPQPNLPPMTSGAQATGAGNGYQYQGSNVAQNMTQQYGAVRPSGLENYSQDLVSMVQESPDMLENPQIYNMLVEQLQGGSMGPKRPMGLEDPLNTAGMVV